MRRKTTHLALFLAIAAVATGCFSRGSDPGAGGGSAPGEPPRVEHDGSHVLVRFRPGTPGEERRAAHNRNGGSVENRLSQLDVDVVKIRRGDTPGAAARNYERNPNIEFAEPNYAFTVHAAPNDPYFPDGSNALDLWGLHNVGQNGGRSDADMDVPAAWDTLGVAGGSPWPAADLTVGIVDSGIDANHPDLSGRVIAGCQTAVLGTGVLTSGCNDDNGHGTHVAGTIAAIANNGRGIAGTAPNARVLPCKALGSDGNGWMSDVAACLNSIVDKRDQYGIDVVSMSIGGPSTNTLRAAADRALDLGVLPFGAAGNEGSSNLNYPAAYESVVSVAATDRNDQRAGFSNANADVELSAPGVDVVSTLPEGRYQGWSGTSMATPHAAAAAALIAWKTGMSATEVRTTLQRSADDLGPTGRDPSFGFGRVNLCRAVAGCGSSGAPTVSTAPASGTTVEDTDDRVIKTGEWTTFEKEKASGGTYARASGTGDKVELTFSGTGIRWVGVRSPSAGITEVRIDNEKVAAVDAYARRTRYGVVLYEVTDLVAGNHEVELVITGKRDRRSRSTRTYLDHFRVL